ncbi:major facilitator superfamily domain-containing protein 12-like isoform X1 [Actinia tenebrosa]|uniref:Major facilitator superfamily domain-containing protein 12-like isoform X1 n=1 Tax=Actinia tenebrosa TaxID=6105 RepID=A0A6P8ILV4_ACTTE|nr:major facilitator superfamily domain-containing protein 12-like isoform X1 [Actinia tenebrosa]
MDYIRRITSKSHTEKKSLPVKQKFSHGVGHILNDLAASVWFSYLIIYLTKVAGLSNRHTGLVVLLGQIADAVFTPFIGILCDRTVCRYGRRKIWHLIGSVLTSLSFPMLFIQMLPEGSSSNLKVGYYVAIAAVFQFGWGCVQISHLSLIPEICHRNNERVELNAIRSALTFICGIYVYGVTWILLGESKDSVLSPSVWKQFMYLAFIIVATGNLFNVLFHAITKEPQSEALVRWLAKRHLKRTKAVASSCNGKKACSEVGYQAAGSPNRRSGATPSILVSIYDDKKYKHSKNNNNGELYTSHSSSNINEDTPLMEDHGLEDNKELEIIDRSKEHQVQQVQQVRTKKQWMTDPTLYKVALIYMCTRIVVNVSQSYLPIYLTETMKFNKEAIAYFPLVVLISGVLASIGVKPLTKRLGSKITYCIGSLMALGACFWYFLQSIEGRNAIYATTVLMGVGGSVMLVTALSLISELIGHDKKSGAFVYGAISFTDKLSSGAVIAIIQELNPRKQQTDKCASCDDYVRNIQSLAPGIAATVALIIAIVFFDSIFVCHRRVEKRDIGVQAEIEVEIKEDKKQDDDMICDNIPRVKHHTTTPRLTDIPVEKQNINSRQTNHSSASLTPNNTLHEPNHDVWQKQSDSFEARNFMNDTAPNNEYTAFRLASGCLPSPLLERRTVV